VKKEREAQENKKIPRQKIITPNLIILKMERLQRILLSTLLLL